MSSPSPPPDGGEGGGEEACFCSGFPSPRSSPHAFLAGRGRKPPSFETVSTRCPYHASFRVGPAQLFRDLRIRQSSLRGGESRHGHTVRRTAHVSQTDAMAEFHRVGIAAVFA